MSVLLARNAAEKLIDRLDVRAAPVDVEGIAGALGLRVFTEDLGSDISGVLVSRDGTASIAVRKGDSSQRKRFTIAHEIGHFYLRHHVQRNELVHADKVSQVIYRSAKASEGMDQMEVQANQFAASLLMPTRLVREHVDQRPKPLADIDVSELARTFNVSEQAMTIRLSTLGLV
jgi:Zn-dependent peptidase ImmA (M78 family)